MATVEGQGDSLILSAVPCVADRWRYEREAWTAGHAVVAGVDEVGRGPLAGPVVSACVVLGRRVDADGIDDSKKLTAAQRERAYARILDQSVAIGIGIVDREQIDAINILRASQASMRLAIRSVRPSVSLSIVLVDGLPVPDLPCRNTRAIVGGDSASISIAAASIVAKVTRDRIMKIYDDLYPGYGFAQHKGYSAAVHFEALRRLGPCPIHRRSFAPVAELLEPSLFDVR